MIVFYFPHASWTLQTHQSEKRCAKRKADQPSPAGPSIALAPSGSNYINLVGVQVQDPFTPLQRTFQPLLNVFTLVEKRVLLLLVVVNVLFHPGKPNVFLLRRCFGRCHGSTSSRCGVRKNRQRWAEAFNVSGFMADLKKMTHIWPVRKYQRTIIIVLF